MKDWKTTVLGVAMAIVIAVQPLIKDGIIDWKAVGFGALIGLFGYLSKDASNPKE